MSRKFSAYLSIFNDWDILPSALRSIASHVDELVVVDGAYEWMVPYLRKLGVDPLRSDPRVYAAIEFSGIPFRIICRIWKNEPEKRQAGYKACAYRHVYRVDADEIIFFDDDALEAMLSRGAAVGEMEMPTYVAPGWLVGHKDNPLIGRQCFLFDQDQVSPEIHLNYLWLILTADTLPMAGTRPFPINPEPLAFNAHLTGWRTPETAVNRAAFYVLNWMRQHGVSWLPGLSGPQLADLPGIFDTMPASVFMSTLRRGRIAFGMNDLAEGRTIRPTTLSAEREATFAGLYDTFLDSLARMNAQAASEEQNFVAGFPTLLDLSTPAARNAVAPSGTITLRLSERLLAAQVRLWDVCHDRSMHCDL